LPFPNHCGQFREYTRTGDDLPRQEPSDEDLERSLVPDQPEWAAFVQEMRRLVASLGIRSLAVTPRATLEGADALRAGMTREDVDRG
jgi:hypothetical protein